MLRRLSKYKIIFAFIAILAMPNNAQANWPDFDIAHAIGEFINSVGEVITTEAVSLHPVPSVISA